MVLPDKLDKIVVECLKELANKSTSDYKIIETMNSIGEIIQHKITGVPELEKNNIINKYLDSNKDFSFTQKKAFLNLIYTCI
jgi:hypothetical protein